ncbi:GH92 family glycosyl hydrolase [Alistipes sp. OttesenSCG-928-B03]|nr:GH92 family glycosyl hydrolase [Alistipes sp. OttesenSCG-928-B03]
MKKLLTLLAVAALAGSCGDSKAPIDYVDPFIGTGFHGHTYPGATAPFGQVQLSPDTRKDNWDACSGYHYSDSTIFGFVHTHLSGTGCADLLDVLFHPTTKEPILRERDYLFEPLAFSHADETASPGYYSVRFPNEGIFAELTAATYTGLHRYTYEAGRAQNLVIDLVHPWIPRYVEMAELAQTGPREITGMRRTRGWVRNQYVFFVAQFSQEIASCEIVDAGRILAEGEEPQTTDRHGIVRFGESDGTPLVVKVGISAVSAENARQNLAHDTGEGFDFDEVHRRTRAEWEKELSHITIEGGSEDERTLFYTGMYHSLIVPNTMSDANGEFRKHDGTIGTAPEGRRYYSTLSLWDTFRAWNPLMTLRDTKLVEDMIWSMLEMYDTTGELPIWPLSSGETFCMIGYHSVSVIADAYIKGIRGFDADKALEAMMRSSDINRKGSAEYLQYGFIPGDLKSESVSCLLEYAYDDWCIARMAKEMGRMDVYEQYAERALSYANVFDGYTRFFRARKSDGNWLEPFNPFAPSAAYTEATAWQYRFFAPHDVNGMMHLFGGRDQFVSALDTLFVVDSAIDGHVSDITGLIGQYAQGNEPSHHMAYLWNWAAEPWKTQQMTRRLLAEQYQATPEGISGNEDCGQMSAWYIMTSLGIYPVCPGTGEYALTTPLFPKATLNLPNGKQLTIKSNDPAMNKYIRRVSLNGREITANFVTHAELLEGGELVFDLAAEPCMERGIRPEDAPYSLTTGQMAAMPYVTRDIGAFAGQTEVVLGTATEDAQIRYTLDGSEPNENSPLYEGPIVIRNTSTLRARTYKDGLQPSREFSARAVKLSLVAPPALGATRRNSLVQGVNYWYYEGSFSFTHQLDGTPALDRGHLPAISIDGAKRDEFFGFVFMGLIDIPEDGLYGFSTVSDDGSVFHIGGSKVVNNDGLHSQAEASGSIALAKGLHPFRLEYIQGSSDKMLQLKWSLPGTEVYTEVPPAALFAEPNPWGR